MPPLQWPTLSPPYFAPARPHPYRRFVAYFVTALHTCIGRFWARCAAAGLRTSTGAGAAADAGDDLGEVGGAPRGQRTQRCRLDAHRVLPAAVPPGDELSDKTHARPCFRAIYWRIRREKRKIRGARSVRLNGPIVACMVRKALIAAHLGANASISLRLFPFWCKSPTADLPPIDLSGSSPFLRARPETS